MNDQASPLARDTAAQYASWFRALADPTRVQILSFDLQPPTRRPRSGRRADPPERQARLHEQAGFRIVGTRRRIGRHHGRWRDTGLIERRSAVVGVG